MEPEEKAKLMPPLEEVLKEWRAKPLLIKMFCNADSSRDRELFFAQWVDGFDSDRFKAEPVFSKTGKGYLKSNGVAGYLSRSERRKFRTSSEYRIYISEMLAKLEEESRQG